MIRSANSLKCIKMGDSHLLLFAMIVLLIRLSTQTESNKCPHNCVCLEQYVDCTRKKLPSVPKIPMWVELLDMSHNRLNENALLNFESYMNLKVLKLDKNKLQAIPNLKNQKNLEDLSLSRNNITSIDVGHFPANNSIKILNLNSNFIKIIKEGALDNLTNLVVLKLNNNEISSLPNHLFKFQANLRTLELNHNKLKIINGLLFQGLQNLTTLKMKYNNIDNIMDGAFFGFESVNLLQLDHNKIKSISKGWMYGLESLTTLSLSRNFISQIDFGSWELCTNLSTVNLSHNHLTQIEGRTFQHLINLRTLNLSANNISSISQEAFSHMIQLQTLLLDNNKISWTVEDMSGPFSKLQNLVKFSLASNHIKSIHARAFEGLSNLVELDLAGNNITSIQQHAFVSMAKLRKLHLNSTSLLCDCNLLWIVKWIRDKSDQKLITATCAYPSEVQGVSIIKLKEDNCGDSPEPKVVEHPRTHIAIKGRSANLHCSATSNPFSNMTFLWRKNNGNISKPMVQENVTISATGQARATSVLIIPNVTHADSGKYQCIVSNNFGTIYSSKAKVNIVTFPRFMKTPTNVTVKTGETVTLNCAATGDPPPEISWKKDGGNDFPAARERRMNVMPTDHLFFIVNAKTTDMGVYSCAAKNAAGTIIANATLSVLEEPSFVNILENMEVTVGGSVVLKCMISGSPKPVLKWSKDGSPIVSTDRHYLTNQDQLLIIVGVESNDAGRYECEITNELGTKKAMTELSVLPPVAIMPGYNQSGYGAPGNQPGYGAPGYGAPPGQLEIGHGPYPSIGPGGGVAPQVQQWFRAVDKDQSGFITAQELKAALVNAQGKTFSETACHLMIGMFDKDRSGHINVEEFDKLYTYINQWLAVFKTYDTDQSGSIDETELTKAFSQMGFRFSPEFINFLAKRCDPKDGKVSVDSFIVLCVQIQRFTEAFKVRDTQQNGTVTIGFEDFLSVALNCSI